MFLKKLLSNDGKQDKGKADKGAPPQGIQTMGVSLQRKFARGVNYNMRIVIKGDRTVGKTCLFLRLQGQKFKEEYIPTDKIQAASIQWNYKATDDVVKVDVWDVVDRGKRKKREEGLKLSTALDSPSSSDPWGQGGVVKPPPESQSADSPGAVDDPCLDAQFIDVYKGTHGVIFVFDITKQWTYDYILRELPQVPVVIPILILANHRDMGHHRTVTEDQVRYFIDELNAERPPNAGKVRYAESSLRNGFGLKYIHKFFNLPFLKLQHESLLVQLETNAREQQLTVEELDMDELSEDLNYDLFLDKLTNRRREHQENLSTRITRPVQNVQGDTRSANGMAAPVHQTRLNEAPPAQTIALPTSSADVSHRPSPVAPTPVTPPRTPGAATSDSGGGGGGGGGGGFMSRLFSGRSKQQAEKNTPMPLEVGCDATTLMSRVRIDDVNDFVPDDHLDASFLDDTRDTKTASAAREDEEEEEEDSDEDGDNPLVANFQDDVESDDDVPVRTTATLADHTANPVVPIPTATVINPAPAVDWCAGNSSSQSKHLAEETRSYDHTPADIAESVSRLPNSGGVRVSGGSDAAEEVMNEDQSSDDDAVGVTILQDEDISSAEDTGPPRSTLAAVTEQKAEEPTVLTQLRLEDLNLLESGFDFTTGLPRPESMSSDMAVGSSRADTDTDIDSSSTKKKKKRHDKQKEKDGSQKKHRKHRDHDKETAGGGEGKRKRSKKKKEEGSGSKREVSDLEAFLGPSVDASPLNTATYEAL